MVFKDVTAVWCATATVQLLMYLCPSLCNTMSAHSPCFSAMPSIIFYC